MQGTWVRSLVREDPTTLQGGQAQEPQLLSLRAAATEAGKP